jgi:hypothetical protein
VKKRAERSGSAVIKTRNREEKWKGKDHVTATLPQNLIREDRNTAFAELRRKSRRL